MSLRGHVDDSGFVGFSDAGPEEVGKIKMPEVVDSHRHLKAIFGLLARRPRENARIIDQYVYLLADTAYIQAELLNRLFVGQVQGKIVDPVLFVFLVERSQESVGFVLISSPEDDGASFAVQRLNGLPADAGVASGDDYDCVGEISIDPAECPSEV